MNFKKHHIPALSVTNKDGEETIYLQKDTIYLNIYYNHKLKENRIFPTVHCDLTKYPITEDQFNYLITYLRAILTITE